MDSEFSQSVKRYIPMTKRDDGLAKPHPDAPMSFASALAAVDEQGKMLEEFYFQRIEIKRGVCLMYPTPHKRGQPQQTCAVELWIQEA